MLYYNSAALFKEEWRLIFTDYRFIKNLPIPLADFALPPLDYFKDDMERLDQKGIIMFEALE